MDKFYTPSNVAAQLANAIDLSSVSGIVDSNCGAGSLLEAATRVYPSADCLGIDSDEDALLRLARTRPGWKLVHGDALDESAWEIFPEFKPDVAVLNPPYSMRTARGIQVTVDGVDFRVSTAMAHVITTLGHSNPKRVVAILPESWAHSQIDSKGRKAIERRYSIEVIQKLTNTTFEGARANALLVLMKRQSDNLRRVLTLPRGLPDHLSLVRGGLPVFEAVTSRAGIPYLHSTDIAPLVRDGCAPRRTVARIGRGTVAGRVILLPRVGFPKRELVKSVYLMKTVQLSDCVIAIKSTKREDLDALERAVCENWDSFLQNYRGTGARFITTQRLEAWLSEVPG
jgi:N-6 DNA Methylase